MSLVDLLILIILAGFVLSGFIFGFVQSLGNLIGSAVALVLANIFVGPVSTAIGSWFGVNSSLVSVFVFFFLFVLIARLVGFGFWILAKMFGFLAWIPFAKTINRILGAGFGLIEGIIVVGLVFYYAQKFLPASVVNSWLAVSAIGGYLLAIVSAVEAVLPAFIQAKK